MSTLALVWPWYRRGHNCGCSHGALAWHVLLSELGQLTVSRCYNLGDPGPSPPRSKHCICRRSWWLCSGV